MSAVVPKTKAVVHLSAAARTHHFTVNILEWIKRYTTNFLPVSSKDLSKAVFTLPRVARDNASRNTPDKFEFDAGIFSYVQRRLVERMMAVDNSILLFGF